MEPTTETPTSGRRNFAIALVVVLVAGIGALVYFLTKEIPIPAVEQQQVIATKEKVYTQAEREEMLARVMVASSSSTKEQAEKLLLLNKTPVKQSSTTLSDEEKIRILNAVQINQ